MKANEVKEFITQEVIKEVVKMMNDEEAKELLYTQFLEFMKNKAYSIDKDGSKDYHMIDIRNFVKSIMSE